MTDQLEPGTHIDSHFGHYQSAYIIEQARSLGWQPVPQHNDKGIPRTQLEENRYVDDMATDYQEWGNLNDSRMDEWYEIVQEAEDYINEHHVPPPDDDAPDGYWYGHHPDIGDVGVWPIEDN